MSQSGIIRVADSAAAVDSVVGANGVTASPTTGAVVVSGVNATTSSVGVASFNSAEFTVTGGQVSLIGGSTAAIQTINNIGPDGAGNFQLLGTTNQVTVTPGANRDTLSLSGPYTPSSYTAHGVLIGEGPGSIVATSVGSTGQVLQGNTAADPTYSTTTYPSTTTVSQILYSSATNTVTGLATGNDGVLITSHTGVPSLLANGTTGQVLTATTGAPPSWATSSGGVTGPGSSTDRAIATWNGSGGTALFDNSTVKISSTGALTNTTQPAFCVYLASTVNNKTGNGTNYNFGTDALTKLYDQTTNVTTGGVFTAPITGIYRFDTQILIVGTTIATVFTSNLLKNGSVYCQNVSSRAASGNNQSLFGNYQLNLTAGDTIQVQINVGGEAADTDDIYGQATPISFFSGALVC